MKQYYLLTTAYPNIDPTEDDAIKKASAEFLRRNDCEIIVNGLLSSIGYYLRLLPDTDCFVFNYASLVEINPDVGYEHRIAWNEICEDI